MFFEGYIGAPPTLTVFSDISAETETAVLAVKAKAAAAATKVRRFYVKRLDMKRLDMMGSILAAEPAVATIRPEHAPPGRKRSRFNASSHGDTAASRAGFSPAVTAA
jgi:hypothetical protein